MAARRVKTYKKELGHRMHREHRSKRGRRPLSKKQRQQNRDYRRAKEKLKFTEADHYVRKLLLYVL